MFGNVVFSLTLLEIHIWMGVPGVAASQLMLKALRRRGAGGALDLALVLNSGLCSSRRRAGLCSCSVEPQL